MDDLEKENTDNQRVNLELINGEVELIKKALELYSYNLEFMIIDEHSDSEERQRKLAMVKYTFETIVAFQAKQVNGIVHNSETLNKFGKNILNTEKLVEFIPKEANIKAM